MIKTIITDIEGTTSSLSFVKDVLFPYAAQNLVSFIEANQNKEEVKIILEKAKEDANLQNQQVAEAMLEWIKLDKKIGSLKELQGLIWEAGYKQGDFKGHIYEDAYNKLKQWQEEGIKIYIYSSGSVKAQQLLFGHTEYGDLNNLFSGYFDTKIGHKKETQSYKNIVKQIEANGDSSTMLFLSDIEAELDAAKEAGMQTIQLVRDVDIDSNSKHKQLSSFSEIEINRTRASS